MDNLREALLAMDGDPDECRRFLRDYAFPPGSEAVREALERTILQTAKGRARGAGVDSSEPASSSPGDQR